MDPIERRTRIEEDLEKKVPRKPPVASSSQNKNVFFSVQAGHAKTLNRETPNPETLNPDPSPKPYTLNADP